MAKKAKRQSPAKKVEATKRANSENKTKVSVKSPLAAIGALFKKINSFLKLTIRSIKKLPGWLKSRPAAIKRWRIEDKKKKKYRSFRLQKKIRPEPRYIPPFWELLKESFSFLWQNKRVIFWIMLIHAIIYVLLLRTPLTTNISEIQSTLKTVLGEGSTSSIQGNLATMGAVIGVGGSGQNSTTASIAIALMSLVYIWAIRQLTNKQKIKSRDAYYQAMTPLVPAFLIVLIMSLQLIPFAAASFVYSTARTGGLFISGFEDFSFFMAALLIGILSFYWITSTIIGIYVVTLPGMYPLKALSASKKLVQFQRFTIFKRILWLPIVVGIFYFLTLLIFIRLLPEQTFWFVEAFPIIILPFIHTYLYKLYRALI